MSKIPKESLFIIKEKNQIQIDSLTNLGYDLGNPKSISMLFLEAYKITS
jgi:hypothetical protein